MINQKQIQYKPNIFFQLLLKINSNQRDSKNIEIQARMHEA